MRPLVWVAVEPSADELAAARKAKSRVFSGDDHPHMPAGSSKGGQFAPKGAGGGAAPKKKSKAELKREADRVLDDLIKERSVPNALKGKAAPKPAPVAKPAPAPKAPKAAPKPKAAPAPKPAPVAKAAPAPKVVDHKPPPADKPKPAPAPVAKPVEAPKQPAPPHPAADNAPHGPHKAAVLALHTTIQDVPVLHTRDAAVEYFHDVGAAAGGTAFRNQLDGHLRNAHGLAPMETTGEPMHTVAIEHLHVSGAYSPGPGHIMLRGVTHRDAKAGLAAVAQGKEAVPSEAFGVHAYVHEAVHGHGPWSPGALDGSGAVIEEAVTDTVARSISRKLLNYQHQSYGHDPLGLPRHNGQFWEVMKHRPYDLFIANTLKTLQDHTGWTPEKTTEAFQAGALAYKRSSGHVSGWDGPAKHLAKHIPGLTAEQRSGLADKLHKELGEVVGNYRKVASGKA